MGLLDYLYVPACAACDAIPATGFCSACIEAVEELGAACPRCAEPFEGPAIESEPLCAQCRRRPPPVEATFAPFRFGGQIAVALRRLKLSRRREIARALAYSVSPLLEAIAPHVDVAIPVPLHWRRMSSRGFNQSELLLRLARPSGLAIDRRSLRRVRATPPQRGLDAAARAANVAGAFAVPARRRSRLTGARVLLVDDVITTGATLFSAATALRAAGAAEVIGLCVARAEAG